MDNRPIGVFDSGLGGLTVVKEIKKILPNEKIIYLGDTARVPYGTRSGDIVIRFSLQNTQFLKKFDIKCLVIACNTASAFACSEIEKSVIFPVLGMIQPGSSGALKKSKNGNIGVIGTKGTISSKAYQRTINKLSAKANIYEFSCPLFVPLIEEGEISGRLIDIIAKKYLSPFNKLDIDTLILGCTHYPIIEEVVKKHITQDVAIINPGKEAAKYLYKILHDNKSLRKAGFVKSEYYLTDLSSSFIDVAEGYLGEMIADKLMKISLEEV